MLRNTASRLARRCTAINAVQFKPQHEMIHTSQCLQAVTTLPLRTGRPTLVVLGTGWAAARLVHDIDPKLYDITVIAPRNHVCTSLKAPLHLEQHSSQQVPHNPTPHLTIPAQHTSQPQHLTSPRWCSPHCWRLPASEPLRAVQWQCQSSTSKRRCATRKTPTTMPLQPPCITRCAYGCNGCV